MVYQILYLYHFICIHFICIHFICIHFIWYITFYNIKCDIPHNINYVMVNRLCNGKITNILHTCEIIRTSILLHNKKSAHELKAVSDVTKSPYMEMNCQFTSIYGKFVTSQTDSFSRADTIVRAFEICRASQVTKN